jgi:hypothetical protein
MSEKARLIAKTSIVDRNPCNPIIMPCDNFNNFPYVQSDYYSQKIFPREIGDIKEYMNDTFTTNINGFTENLGKMSVYDNNKFGVYYDGKPSSSFFSPSNENNTILNKDLNNYSLEMNMKKMNESLSTEKEINKEHKTNNLKKAKIENSNRNKIS